MNKRFYVYFMSNDFRNVLYVGVTSQLVKRIEEHKAGIIDGFTKRYNVKNFVYFEDAPDWESAITREKEIKGWKRWKKDRLVNRFNPSWRDLSEDFSK
ncbi:GIY-YIG nuclease family protein [Candidatus Uhrbacteria bacterium]|nr:MAG: GIY-YIG nuclease family protein [Candidatus Uhrbacteria bacterium]